MSRETKGFTCRHGSIHATHADAIECDLAQIIGDTLERGEKRKVPIFHAMHELGDVMKELPSNLPRRFMRTGNRNHCLLD